MAADAAVSALDAVSLDSGTLMRRAQTIGDTVTAQRVAEIAAAIRADHSDLQVDEQIGRLRISGRGLGERTLDDARLRNFGEWLR